MNLRKSENRDMRDQVEYLSGELETLKKRYSALEDSITKQGKHLNALRSEVEDNDG